jgi:alanine dehydrogenase
MRVGVPKEIKNNENRVALTPSGARRLAEAGHEVVVERGAGLGSGFSDADFEVEGASLGQATDAWGADLVVKVKEPLASEYPHLRDQILFTYLHLAGVDPELTDALLAAGTTAIAYETVTDDEGGLPLLAPMSAVAGSMAPVMGSYHLGRFGGGRGVLIADILGEIFGKVSVIGDGVVGRHAARVAAAMGGRVVIFGRHAERRDELEAIAPGVEFCLSTAERIAEHLIDSDLLVGAVLIEGARAPHVVTRSMVAAMAEGSVIVDVSIDQGGCVETSRPTSHSEPVFSVDGVIHYCVTNMPGAYPRTSTLALTRATLPYALEIASGGIGAVLADPGLARGVNVHAGFITCEAVAKALGRRDDFRAFETIARDG